MFPLSLDYAIMANEERIRDARQRAVRPTREPRRVYRPPVVRVTARAVEHR
jgi:hypothetical protein